MKQKFIAFIQKYMAPWVDGADGLPWTFNTDQLVQFGNKNLPPDQVVDKEGNINLVLLSAADVVEAMTELRFKESGTVDPHAGLSTIWEVEALPSLII